ncbi:MAG: class I SAM-dependent methyltransferase [Phenylobacterium sp.]
MAYLRLRRMLELAVLDRPGLVWLLGDRGSRRSRQAPAERWEALYEEGTYDVLLDSDRRHHHRLLAGLVAERAPGGRILEIGCGQGAFYQSLRPLRPAAYLGTDIAAGAIDRARARFAEDVAAGVARFEVADGAQFDSEARFDAVIFADCLEYLGPVSETLRRYRALLAPGGFFGATQWLAPHPLRLWRELKSEVEVLDEALVSTRWGGAWQVWTCRPRVDRP